MTVGQWCLHSFTASYKVNMMMRWLMIGLLAGLLGCDNTSSSVETWPMVQQCNLHQQPCTATKGQAQVTLDIRPRPIPVAKPLDVTVTLSGIQAKSVALDISGINMYMGYNRVDLQPAWPGRWTGQSMLAFCTNQKMEWRLSVLITQPDGSQVMVPFYLLTRTTRQ